MDVIGTLNFTIEETTPERVTGRMPIQSGMLNPFGVVHAGAILWFADVCASVLAMGKTDIAEGETGFPLAVNLNASLIGNQSDGEFHASSVFVKRGRRLNVVRTTVSGQGGRLIAEVTTSHIPA